MYEYDYEQQNGIKTKFNTVNLCHIEINFAKKWMMMGFLWLITSNIFSVNVNIKLYPIS